MDAKIYRDVQMGPDKLVGRIDDEGRIYDVESGSDKYPGWIDYDEGEIFDESDDLMGWIEDDGMIVGYYDEDSEEEIGYVTEDGELYGYDADDNDVYVGKVANMQDATEGAAAMLFFFDYAEEE